jgi:hypothetical protein
LELMSQRVILGLGGALLVLLIVLGVWQALAETGEQPAVDPGARPALVDPVDDPVARQPTPSTVDALPTPLSPAYDPLEGGRIVGDVLSASGVPLPPESVRVVAAASADTASSAHPDALGRYELGALSPGRWTLTCVAEGYQTQARAVFLTAEHPVVREDFSLRRTTSVRVYVLTSDGVPFWLAAHQQSLQRLKPGLAAVATVEPPPSRVSWRPGARRLRFGAGRLQGNPSELGPDEVGILVLEEPLPVHVSLLFFGAVLDSQWVEPGTDAVFFALQPDMLLKMLSTVRVRVVGPDGETPVERCTLSSGPTNPPGCIIERKDDGVFILGGLVPGTHILSFGAPGHVTRTLDVIVELASEVDLGTVELKSAAALACRVHDLQGNPLSVTFLLGHVDRSNGQPRFDRSRLRRSDASGRLAVEGLLPGLYVLRSLGPHESRDASADGPSLVSGVVAALVTPDSTEEVAIRLERGGSLELRTNRESVRYRLMDQGYALREGQSHPDKPARMLVPRKTYQLLVTDKAGEVLHDSWVDIGDEPLQISVDK